jgi:hypothetical protein
MIALFVIFFVNLIINLCNINSKNKILVLFLSCSFLNLYYISISLEVFFTNILILIFYIFIIINFYTIWNSSIRIEIIRKYKRNINFNNKTLLQNRRIRFQNINNTIMNKKFFIIILAFKKIFNWILNEKK